MAESTDYIVQELPFPAKSKSSTASINDVETTATCIYFSDKILITISQSGRLAHWVHVPLDITTTDSSLTSTSYLEEDLPPSDLLPMTHLTATTVLGGTVPEIDTWGQLLATQIASAVVTRDSGEKRMVVVGMGLEKGMSEEGRGREAFSEVVGLVLGVL